MRWPVKSGRAWQIAFLLAVAVNLAVLYAPSPGGAPAVRGLDKVIHVVVFAAVAYSGARAGLPARALVPALLLHAVVSELVQHTLLPSRTGDPLDLVADGFGTLVGWVLVRGRRGETMVT